MRKIFAGENIQPLEQSPREALGSPALGVPKVWLAGGWAILSVCGFAQIGWATTNQPTRVWLL